MFPTKYNQNKFMLGMGIERLFTEIICVHSTRNIVELCDKNETRVDIKMLKNNLFSLKYSTPSSNGSLGNIRLINKHSKTIKDYTINNDLLIVVPNSSLNTNSVYDFENNKFCCIELNRAQLLFEKFGINYVIEKTEEKLTGKLIYIPSKYINHKVLKETQDGIELSSQFLNDYIKNPTFKKNIIHLNIPIQDGLEELDIIKIGLERALGMSFRYCK